MKSYRDLDVYRGAHALGIACHLLSMRLPKVELYETGSQLRRASKSVSANIVEGYGRRRYKADYIRFLVFAHASCDETVEWLQYILDVYPDQEEQVQCTLNQANQVGARLNRFIQAVEAKHNEFESSEE
ncbi:MAG: four helix bundle protein [Spartobacteria bacterium]|nr:four helix bundle protein [Spartobacteria bacterium]